MTIAESVKCINRKYSVAAWAGDKELAHAYFILANFVENFIAEGRPVHG
jgi:hypothetical protein